MNTGDLQYVAGDLYVAGKITSPFAPVVPPADYVTSVVSQAPVSAATSGSVVTMSYAGLQPKKPGDPTLFTGVPVNCIFGADNGAEGALVLPLSGNIAVTGGQIEPQYEPNCLPIGRIICQTVLGATYPNQPDYTDGSLQITNCGIGDIIFGEGSSRVEFTGIGTGAGTGFPPGPGQVVFLEGDGIQMLATKDLGPEVGGGGEVVVSNTGVLSVSAPAAPSLQQAAKRSRSASGFAAAVSVPQTGALSLVGGTNMTVEQTAPGEFTFSASGASIAGVTSIQGESGGAVVGEVAFASANAGLTVVSDTAAAAVQFANTGVIDLQTTGVGLAIQVQTDAGGKIVTLANSGVFSIASGTGISAGPKINGVSTVSNTGLLSLAAVGGLQPGFGYTGAVTLADTSSIVVSSTGLQGESVFSFSSRPQPVSPSGFQGTFANPIVQQEVAAGGNNVVVGAGGLGTAYWVDLGNPITTGGAPRNTQSKGYLSAGAAIGSTNLMFAVYYPGLTASSILTLHPCTAYATSGTPITPQPRYQISAYGLNTGTGADSPYPNQYFFMVACPTGGEYQYSWSIDV
jgi:hypothetical protein